jgi:hypothetical protein
MPTKNDSITLEYYKRWPESERSRKWRKKRVNIFTEGQGWWRPQAAGYTFQRFEAWVVPFETAIAHTRHISVKDKKIEFHLVDMPGNTL